MTADAASDAVVIGSGPNGLVAAVALASKGWDVTVLERAPVPGGAIRSEQLTAPGYVHDTFSAFYGLLHATPVFEELGLSRRVAWADFERPVGAAVAPDVAAAMHRDRDRTAAGLGADGPSWLRLCRWWDRSGTAFLGLLLASLGSVVPALRFVARSGVRGALDTTRMLLSPVEDVAHQHFDTEVARVLLSCGISHADIPVSQNGSTPLALVLAMIGQTVGMPIPVGGAGRLTDALVGLLEERGGRIRTGDGATKVIVERGRAVAVETEHGNQFRVRHAVVADTGPLQLFRDLVGEEHLPQRFLDGLRAFRYGTGMFRLDLALDGPAPWLVDVLRSTGVVHVMGTLDDMARAAFEARRGLLPARPMLVVGQQSIADPTRAPAGGHTLWIETHTPPVPKGDAADGAEVRGWEQGRERFTERILALLEDHAPGLGERIVGTHVQTPLDLEAKNPNLVGGDVNGGSAAIDMQLIFRPVPGWFRYRTPVKGLYMCSASTHPGGGVHGMGGRNCATRVLRDSWSPRGLLQTAAGARRAPRLP